MSRPCAVMRCGQPSSGYSIHCEAHKRTLSRHGHPEQSSVSSIELKPYLARVAARKVKNPDNPAWDLLQRRWEALTGHAQATLDSFTSGTPVLSYERQAAQQLVVLRDSAPAEAVIDVALAMFAFIEDRPARFKSDKAFGFQLTRRVRRLAEVNTGSHWSAAEGRMKRNYRDLPTRVLNCLAESLKVAFGVAGIRLALLDKRDAEGLMNERQQLHDALGELK